MFTYMVYFISGITGTLDCRFRLLCVKTGKRILGFLSGGVQLGKG